MRKADKIEIALIVGSGITATIAIVALVIALISLSNRLSEAHRTDVRICAIMRRVVIAAALINKPSQLPAAYSFLSNEGMGNCNNGIGKPK